MKIVIDIKDSKVDFIMELLNNFSFVKTESPVASKKSNSKAVNNINKQQFINDMEQTIKEIEADFYEKNNKNKKLRKTA